LPLDPLAVGEIIDRAGPAGVFLLVMMFFGDSLEGVTDYVPEKPMPLLRMQRKGRREHST
jgi:hypothetical protein